MDKQQIVAGTLAWCNERRAEKDMEKLEDLPKGLRRDGESCPCGTATGLFVGAIYYWESSADRVPVGRIPEVVGTFVQEFDAGRYPEYER